MHLDGDFLVAIPELLYSENPNRKGTTPVPGEPGVGSLGWTTSVVP